MVAAVDGHEAELRLPRLRCGAGFGTAASAVFGHLKVQFPVDDLDPVVVKFMNKRIERPATANNQPIELGSYPFRRKLVDEGNEKAQQEMMEMLDLTRAVGDRDMPILFRM